MKERILVATDGEIDIATSYEHSNNFDIYLHDTDELIGNIWYDNGNEPEFNKYYGNVGYEIKENYQGNKYAYKALLLIKKIMLDNKINKMIFSVKPENIASIKTVTKLGANLACHRPIPNNHKLYDLSGSETLIYEYDIRKNNKKL